MPIGSRVHLHLHTHTLDWFSSEVINDNQIGSREINRAACERDELRFESKET